MIFSTKAEYGVRVMVELARRGGEQPVALAEIAEHEGLPLAYLEHLVARLRRAGLVESRRGAHGGYLLARDPAQITMAAVVEALEGRIAAIECYATSPDGSIHCVLEGDPKRVCTSKILWTRVRDAIVTTLEQTTLAELIPTPTPKKAVAA
jgi:Rrf2 family protein